MRIRRGLGSRRLACGCLAGIYETYRDETVTIVDAKGPACVVADHVAGNLLSPSENTTARPVGSSDR